MGNWNWCFGPAPFGLHYGRYLYRDGVERGNARVAAMQPEAAGAVWDETQTWRSEIDEEDHPTTWTADVAIDWLRARAATDEPFFGWVSFADPHHPMDPPARWFDMYDPADVAEVMPEQRDGELDSKPPVHALWSRGARGGPLEWANPGGASLTDAQLARMIAAYYGMVSQLDHNIGRILDTLDELGIADDTMVVMTTDHGEMLGDHRIIFKGPVHYEGLLRVPLIVRGPGVAAGAVVDDPVGTIDLAPTMLRGRRRRRARPHGGRVRSSTSTGRRPDREHVLTEDDFDAVLRVPLRTITTERHKLTAYLDAPGQGELYDLVEDPGEFVNLLGRPGVRVAAQRPGRHARRPHGARRRERRAPVGGARGLTDPLGSVDGDGRSGPAASRRRGRRGTATTTAGPPAPLVALACRRRRPGRGPAAGRPRLRHLVPVRPRRITRPCRRRPAPAPPTPARPWSRRRRRRRPRPHRRRTPRRRSRLPSPDRGRSADARAGARRRVDAGRSDDGPDRTADRRIGQHPAVQRVHAGRDARRLGDVRSHPRSTGRSPTGATPPSRHGARWRPRASSCTCGSSGAGGDPNATGDAASGPWNWNLVPTAGSRQTLVLVDDGGLHITRIDDRRARRRGEARVGPRRADRPAAADRWEPRASGGASSAFGCNGVTTADKGEFDLPRTAGLQLSGANDATCASAIAGPVTLPSSRRPRRSRSARRRRGGRGDLVRAAPRPEAAISRGLSRSCSAR